MHFARIIANDDNPLSKETQLSCVCTEAPQKRLAIKQCIFDGGSLRRMSLAPRSVSWCSVWFNSYKCSAYMGGGLAELCDTEMALRGTAPHGAAPSCR